MQSAWLAFENKIVQTNKKSHVRGQQKTVCFFLPLGYAKKIQTVLSKNNSFSFGHVEVFCHFCDATKLPLCHTARRHFNSIRSRDEEWFSSPFYFRPLHKKIRKGELKHFVGGMLAIDVDAAVNTDDITAAGVDSLELGVEECTGCPGFTCPCGQTFVRKIIAHCLACEKLEESDKRTGMCKCCSCPIHQNRLHVGLLSVCLNCQFLKKQHEGLTCSGHFCVEF